MRDESFDGGSRGLRDTLDTLLGRDTTVSTPPSSVDIDTLYARGRDALVSGRFDDAVRALQEVVQRRPNHSWAHYLLARAHHPLGNKTQAEEHFRRSVALRPAFSLDNITEARRHLDRKEYVPALWAAERAALVARYTSAPETTLRTIAETLNTVGVAFKDGKEAEKNLSKAKHAFETATAIDPHFVHPYYHLGTIAQTTGDREAAVSYYQRTLTLDPKHRWAQQRLTALSPLVRQPALEYASPAITYVPSRKRVGVFLEMAGRDWKGNMSGPYAGAKNFIQAIKKYSGHDVTFYVPGPTHDPDLKGLVIPLDYLRMTDQQLTDLVTSFDAVHVLNGRHTAMRLAKVTDKAVMGPNVLFRIPYPEELSAEDRVRHKEILDTQEAVSHADWSYILTPNPGLEPLYSERLEGKHGPIIAMPYGLDTSLFKPDPFAQKEGIVWIGGGPAKGGDLIEQVQQLVRGEKWYLLGKDQRFKWPEHIPYLQKAKVFVSTSRYETQGIATMEAMACGAPVVIANYTFDAHDGRGKREQPVPYHTNGVTSVVTSRDPSAIAAAINDLLANQEKRQKLGEAGRAYVRSGFSLEAMAAQYDALIQRKCLEDRNGIELKSVDDDRARRILTTSNPHQSPPTPPASVNKRRTAPSYNRGAILRQDRTSSKRMNDYTALEDAVKDAEGTTFRDGSWRTEPVSVIVTAYNSERNLRKTLQALAEQSYPTGLMEVIIADDGGSDNSRALVKELHLPFTVKYVWQQDKGYRLSRSRNNGLKNATHDKIIVIDNDIVVDTSFVETYMKWHHVADSYGTDVLLTGRRQFVRPEDVTLDRITSHRLAEVPRVASTAKGGSPIDWREQKLYPETNFLKDLSAMADPRHVLTLGVVGCNLSFTKSRAFAAGLFDEDFTRWGAEDKLFGDQMWYTQALFPERPFYIVPVMDAVGLHMEHPVSGRQDEDKRVTAALYRTKIQALKAKEIFPAPKVSVYVPAWNVEQFIEQTIDSVRAQTYKDVEVCVVEDRGTDHTWSVLEQLTHKYNKSGERPFLRIERNEKNRGIGPTSNRAVRMCRGEYILQLDSDDYLHPECIERLLGVFEKEKNLGVVFGDSLDILPNGTTRPHWSPAEFTEADIAKCGYQKFLDLLWDKSMRVTHPRMFKREAFYKTEGFAEDIVNAIDYDIFMKLSEVAEVRHLPEILYYYRTNHGRNTTVRQRPQQVRNAAIVQQRGRERRVGTQRFQFTNVEPNPVYDFIPDKQWPVSVYMPLSLGNIRYLEESLDSILTQTHQRTGICIGVDDTPENAAAFFSFMKEGKYARFFDATNPNYGRIKYKFTNITGGSSGAAAASNAAMDLALDSNKSIYVLHLDPDDKYCQPHAIERLVQFMEKDLSCILGYADFNLFRDGKREGVVVSEHFSRKKLWRSDSPYNQVGHPRIYRAEPLHALRAANNGKTFNEALTVCVDLDLILRTDKLAEETGRAIKHYDGEGTPFLERFQGGQSVFVDYRIHPDSITARKAADQATTYRRLIATYSDTSSPLSSPAPFSPLIRFTSLQEAGAK